MKENKEKSFLYGISTSSYHIEGGNHNSDWAEFEKRFFFSSIDQANGEGIKYWQNWKSDHKFLSKLGTNAYRTSIEWSRIFPYKNEPDLKALAEYKKIFKDLKAKKIQVIVTFFHFVSPLWFAQIGGFTEKKNLIHFERFVDLCLEELHEYIDIVTPINEILTYVSNSYFFGFWPPQIRDAYKSIKVTRNLIRAHFITTRLIELRGYDIKISTSEHCRYLEYCGTNPFINFIELVTNYLMNYAITSSIYRNRFLPPIGFFKKIMHKRHRKLDYIGIQFYGRVMVNVNFSWKNLRVELKPVDPQNKITIKKFKDPNEYNFAVFYNSMHNRSLKNHKYLYRTLKRFNRRFKLPILITESGIPTNHEGKRIDFIKKSFSTIRKAKRRGVDVRGFFFFTLFDSFEWTEGYTQKFGLISVGRKTFKRTPKKSYDFYKSQIEKYTRIGL